jgi:hypothetical protein
LQTLRRKPDNASKPENPLAETRSAPEAALITLGSGTERRLAPLKGSVWHESNAQDEWRGFTTSFRSREIAKMSAAWRLVQAEARDGRRHIRRGDEIPF